jgi:hypothetical protein
VVVPFALGQPVGAGSPRPFLFTYLIDDANVWNHYNTLSAGSPQPFPFTYLIDDTIVWNH